jgi:hypothetical protein
LQQEETNMTVDETRAVAKLPHLDIEIHHRQAPEEGTEYLSITLRATPDLGTAAAMLDPFRLLAATAVWNPWHAWLRLANPWLPIGLLGGPGRRIE